MKEIHFKVDLSVSELYMFSMRHTYYSPSGVFGVVLSVACLLMCILRYEQLDGSARLALFIIGLLFTVVQPVMLYGKACTQRMRNKDINATLQYCVSESGIQVSQGEQQVEVPWYDVRKMVQGKSALYLYMSPVRAFIFPRKQCGGQYEELVALIRTMMERYKDYEPAEEEPTDSDGQKPEEVSPSKQEAGGAQDE